MRNLAIGKFAMLELFSYRDFTRFWSKVEIGKKDECWPWMAGGKEGYGWFGLSSKKQFACHRITYEMFFGSIEEGMELDHLCRNRKCVNPFHLEVVTHLENVRRGQAGIYNRLKTHCPQGHPYDESNTSYKPQKWRQCKACGREKAMIRRAKIRASKLEL
jgi:hypothetical protein